MNIVNDDNDEEIPHAPARNPARDPVKGHVPPDVEKGGAALLALSP